MTNSEKIKYYATSIQPKPVITDKSRKVSDMLDDIPDGVVKDMIKERIEFGRNKYGCELHSHNGRDMSVDVVQELLDAIVYMLVMDYEQGCSCNMTAISILQGFVEAYYEDEN